MIRQFIRVVRDLLYRYHGDVLPLTAERTQMLIKDGHL